jgi:hypothetical protein
VFHEIIQYSRMAWAFRSHLRSPVDLQPERRVRDCMENRESNFLLQARAVLGEPTHPYSQLFQVAGCTYADLENAVRRDGIETTLAKLLREGVYLGHDEFRGRTEIVRGGRHIRSAPSDWMNHCGQGQVTQSSSGSSGRPVRTGVGQDYLTHLAAWHVLFIRELGLEGRAGVNVGPILPGFGILAAVLASRIGMPFERWYAPSGGAFGNQHYRFATGAIVSYLRLNGASIPHVKYLKPGDYAPAAEYLARRQREGAHTWIAGFVSAITRIAAAAVEWGLDLRGCRAWLVGEALTDAKRAMIESAGIEPYPTYSTTDFGSIGFPCREMRTGNCVHVLSDFVALATRPADAEGGAESLCVTSLQPFAPRVLINVEIGDTGIVEKSRCQCSLSKLGLGLQVRNMAAISKVTAQGVMIAADDLVKLLEELMPARFGGRPGDYQLVEREGASQTEAELRILPGVTTASPREMLDFFLNETRRLYGGSLSVLSWTHSDGIRVVLAPPLLAGTTKFRAVRLLGSGTDGAAARRASRT